MAAGLLPGSCLLYFPLLPRSRLARTQAHEEQGSRGPQTCSNRLQLCYGLSVGLHVPRGEVSVFSDVTSLIVIRCNTRMCYL